MSKFSCATALGRCRYAHTIYTESPRYWFNRPGGYVDPLSEVLSCRYVAIDLCAKVQGHSWGDPHGIPDTLANA
jgi:hypothetical protein